MIRCAAFLCLGAACRIAALPADSTRISASAEASGWLGYHSNPVYVSQADQAAGASALAEGRVNADARITLGSAFAFHSGLDGDLERYPANAAGDASSGRWSADLYYFPWGRKQAGAKRKHPFLSAGYRLEADGNTILGNPDRYDEELTRLPRLIQRGRISGNLPTDRAGLFRLDASASRADFGESASLLASLDQEAGEFAAGWESPKFGGLRADLGYAYEMRGYDRYPARDIFGDTVLASRKRYAFSRLSAGAEYAVPKRWEARLGYGLEMQTDLYAGYFDAVTHTFSARAKLRFSRALSLSAGGETGFKNYAHYRSYYNPLKPLKRIRSDRLSGEAEYGFGRYFLGLEFRFRNETNAVPKYAFQAWQARLGGGFRF